jgi:4-amino-4-deoxy-L-arabinose transferase-like glycosyltransferase
VRGRAAPRFGAWWSNAYTRGERLWLVALVVVAVAVRVGWVVLAARRAMVGDPVAYTYHGAQLARGQGYRSFFAAYTTLTPPERSGTFPPTAFYPIGYPAALAVVFWLVFHTPLPDNLPRAVGFFQVGLGAGSVLLAAEVARHVLGSRVAVYTAALMAVFPSLVYYTAEAHLETLFNFLVLAAVLIVVAGPWHDVSRKRLLLFGFVLGLSALVRPFSLLVLPGLFLVWLLSGTRWRPALARTAWAALAVVVVVSPWLARNVVVMKAPVFSTGIGDALCDSRHKDAGGSFEVAAKYCLEGYDHLPSDQREVQRNRDNTRKALRFVVEHPGDEARLMFWRGYYAYRDDHDALVVVDADPTHPLRDSDFRPVLATLADIYYVVVAGLALLGLPAFLRRRHPKRLFVAVVMAGTGALPFILFGDPRYHVPVLPFLVIAAAAALGARRGPGLGASPRTTPTFPAEARRG